MRVPVQNGAHDMHELNVAGLTINAVAGHHVPTGMSVVALSALANLNCRFDFQADGFSLFGYLWVDQIGIRLM